MTKIIIVTSSPFPADNEDPEIAPPWEYHEDGFINWVWEVFEEGYKYEEECSMSLDEAIEIVEGAGYEIKIITENCKP
jgi:hypothetical protein